MKAQEIETRQAQTPGMAASRKAMRAWFSRMEREMSEGFSLEGPKPVSREETNWEVEPEERWVAISDTEYEYTVKAGDGSVEIKFDVELKNGNDKTYRRRLRAKAQGRKLVREPVLLRFEFSGHTAFECEKGRFSFDRYGVSDSFYGDSTEAPGEVLAREIERCRVAAERKRGQEPVPVLGFYVTPEKRQEIAQKLRAGKSHTFTPSGFGTGYRLYAGPPRRSWDHRGDSKIAAFFGLDSVSYETMDCD